MSALDPSARTIVRAIPLILAISACGPSTEDVARDALVGWQPALPPDARGPGVSPGDTHWTTDVIGQSQSGDASPLAGWTLYVDPASNAARQVEEWREDRAADAARMDKIARHAVAAWLGEWSGDVEAAVRARADSAEAADALASFVVYGIPDRDCGSHSAGGAEDADAYTRWIDGIAAGLDGREALFVIEPDALALTDCLDASGLSMRAELLRHAVRTLSAAGGWTYLDAGHAAWVPAADMAARLSAAGVDEAAGFALNVSNFRSDDESVAYGDAIHALTGARYVVDSSRNGLGPDGDAWCNPPDRALGQPPDTDPDPSAVDAFLWVKAPGESDGSCNGGPSAGAWWPEYALGLAERAAWE
jgi:endoglucanase